MQIEPCNQIRKLPSYFLTQVHPENNVIAIFSAANSLFEQIQQISWNAVCHRYGITNPNAPKPSFLMETSEKDPISVYNNQMSLKCEHFLSGLLQPMLPPESPNYYAALKFIEEELLDKNIKELTPKDILTIVKQLNACIEPGTLLLGSVYRACEVFILNDNVMPKETTKETFKLLDQHILSECTSPSQKELWKTTRAKVWKFKFAKETVFPKFTAEEMELIKSVITGAPDYKQIPLLMKKFADELCSKIKNEENILSIMSWTHQTLIEIHPFFEGNGRTARLFMNLLGMWSGKEPALIANSAEYTDKSRSLDAEAFREYLKSNEEKQVKLLPLFEEALRFRFNEVCDLYKADSLCSRVKQISL